MELDYKAIGKRIKKVRKEQQITQRELAEIVNVSESHISNIERGKKPLSLPTLIAICNALNVTADRFLFDNYAHNDEFSPKDVFEYFADEDKQRMSLTIKVAEAIRQWWNENEKQ